MAQFQSARFSRGVVGHCKQENWGLMLPENKCKMVALSEKTVIAQKNDIYAAKHILLTDNSLLTAQFKINVSSNLASATASLIPLCWIAVN